MKKDTNKDIEQVKFSTRFLKILYSGLQWTAIGVLGGLFYGLIKGGIANAINNGIYIVGMLMLFYTIVPVEELAMITMNKDKTYDKKDVQELRKGKLKRMNKQLWNFLRTAVVFAIAIVMELIRFYVL